MNAENNSISVTRAGVVDISSRFEKSFAVNAEDLIDLIEKAVYDAKPSPCTDQYSNFAGRVTITIEFLGDMKPIIEE